MSRRQSKRRTLLRWAAVAPLVALLPGPGHARGLLHVEQIDRSFGVIREQRLVDGVVPAGESPIDDFTATLFLGPGAEIVFALDPVRATSIRLVAIDDGVAAEISGDGKHFTEVTLEPVGRVGAMTVWGADGLPPPVQAVRLRLREGRRMGAVGEVLLSRDAGFSLPVRLQEPPTYEEAVDRVLGRRDLIRRGSVVVALAAALLLGAAFRWTGRRRLVACGVLAGTGAAVFLGFGTLRGDGGLLHPWELTHYYLGSKYFDELRYRELYRCLAAWERQQGRGAMVDRVEVRDLDDNARHPGAWSATAAGACRAGFSAERWASFGEDADRLRRLFRFRHFHALLGDHGYNATPLQTLMLQQAADRFRPARAPLRLLGIVDLALLGLAVGLIAWGFGPIPGAVAALIAGFGHAWDLSWNGGSLGRYVWLVALAGGLALLGRRRPFAGAALVAVSGALRLFPLALLAGLAWRFLRRSVSGTLQPEDRRGALGAGLALLLGLALPLAAFGGGVYEEFLANSQLHASRPPGNDLGLGALCRFGSSPSDGGPPSSGPYLRGSAWGLGLLLSLVLLIRIERGGAQAWELVVWSGPLLFASLPLSGYDYAWLILLAPVLATGGVRAVPAVLLIALGKLAPELAADDPGQHLMINALLLAGLVALILDELARARRPRRRQGARPAAERLPRLAGDAAP